MTTYELQNAGFIQDQQIKTDSFKVAELFGKRHGDIIRALKNIDCSTDFSERNFALAEYLDEQGKPRPMYEMTKDGFIFLAMGFTGVKAAQVKEAYINAFNQMAELLLKQQNQLQTIQVGSMVQLRSGSPNLTVQRIIGEVAEVLWFKNGKLFKETLPLSCLSLGENDQITPAVASSLEMFWSNLYTHGVHNFNHSNRTDQIAINLTQVLDLFPDFLKRTELTQILPHSKAPYPKYIEHNIPVQSRLERKTIRCWVFKSTQPTMIDVHHQGGAA